MKEIHNFDKIPPPKKQKRLQEPALLVAMLAIMIGLAIAAYMFLPGLMLWWESLYDDAPMVYTHDGEKWQTVSALPGEPAQLAVSPSGAVWLTTKDSSTLTQWRDGQIQQFDTGENKIRDFVPVGETVWAVSEHDVIHINGSELTKYENVPDATWQLSIAATHSDVWLVNSHGDFVHFDGRNWSQSDLTEALPNVAWQSNNPLLYALTPPPDLITTPDDTLWLEMDGLWRYNGRSWQMMWEGNGRVDSINLLGTVENSIWIWADGLHVWSDAGWQQPSLSGIPEQTKIIQVANNGQLIVTKDAVFQQQDGVWRPLPSPNMTIQTAAVADDIWVIVAPDSSMSASMKRLLAKYALFGAAAALVNFGGTWITRKKPKKDQVSYTPDPFDSPKQKPDKDLTWRGMLETFLKAILKPALLGIGVFGIPAIIYLAWPQIPLLAPAVIGLLLWWVGPPLGKRVWAKVRQQEDVKRPSFFRELGKTAVIAFAATLTVTPIALLLYKATTSGMGAIQQALWIYLVGMIIPAGWFGWFFLPQFWVNKAVHQGNYKLAQQRQKQIDNIMKRQKNPLNQLPILYLANQLEKAQTVLNQPITDSNKVQPDIKEMLEQSFAQTRQLWQGKLYLEQGNYDGATAAFQKILDMQSTQNQPNAAYQAYNGLAEVLLRQGMKPEHALTLLQQALNARPGSISLFFFGANATAEIMVNQAWALALLRRFDEAETTLHAAFRQSSKRHKPQQAGLHFRAAQVWQLIGYKEKAFEHRQLAAELDPDGLYGRLAQT